MSFCKRYVKSKPDPVLEIMGLLLRWLIAIFAIVISLLIVIGGEIRWRGEPFQVAMELPGAPESWGWFMLVFGVTLFIGLAMDFAVSEEKRTIISNPIFSFAFRTRVDMTIFFSASACGLWCWSLGTSFGLQLLNNPVQVSNLDPAIWFFIGVLYMLSAASSLKILQP